VLAACPVSVCVVSNTDDDDLQSALRHVGLRFDMVVTSEDCRSYRPRPEMFEKALSLLGLPAGEVLHIGDSIRSDIAGAKAAGIPMLWINPDGRQAPAELTPDYVSRDLTGLLEFFEHGHPV
jgi:2-haloacid dehalogenase/putative hydrolase of the HAD superfamily